MVQYDVSHSAREISWQKPQKYKLNFLSPILITSVLKCIYCQSYPLQMIAIYKDLIEKGPFGKASITLSVSRVFLSETGFKPL